MKLVSFKDICEDNLAIAKQCEGVIEATSFESHVLWQQHSPESKTRFRGMNITSWEHRSSGSMFSVGEFGGSEVCVEISFARINGKWVMFYNACSQVVDHRLVDQWLKEHMSHAVKTDANNSHIVFHHVTRKGD